MTADPPSREQGPAQRQALAAIGVSIDRGGVRAVRDAELRIDEGEKVALVGPNGSGKTSLLRALAGLAPPARGEVRIRGRDTRSLPDRERARLAASLGQDEQTDLPFTARDVLLLGRSAGLADWRPVRAADHAAIERLAGEWGLGRLLDRPLQRMSGGERRRVLIARVFAQATDIILLDEPTNHLDLRHQHTLLSRIAASPLTAVLALHELDLASAYCTRAVLLSEGRVLADGPPGEVLTPERIRRVYGVRAHRAEVAGRTRLLIG